MNIAFKPGASACGNGLLSNIISAHTVHQIDQQMRSAYTLLVGGMLDDRDIEYLAPIADLCRRIVRPTDTVRARAPHAEKGPSRFPKRVRPGVPDELRAESWARRKRLAKECPIPAHLVGQFTTARLAVLNVIAWTCAMKKQCNMSLREIAGRAGTGCTMARYAIRQAAEMGLIAVQENGVRGKLNLPNTIRVVAFSWKRWLQNAVKWKREADARKKSAANPAEVSDAPPLTNLRPTAEKFIEGERDKPAPINFLAAHLKGARRRE